MKPETRKDLPVIVTCWAVAAVCGTVGTIWWGKILGWW